MKGKITYRLLFIVVLALCLFLVAFAVYNKVHITSENPAARDEIIANYTPENPDDVRLNFDKLTTCLIPGIIESSPLSATFMYSDLHDLGLDSLTSKLDQYGPNAFEDEVNRAENITNNLKQINYFMLAEEQKETYDMLMYQNQLIIDGDTFRYYDNPIEPSSGIQTNLPLSLVQIELTDEQDIKNYLNRLSELPRLFDQIIDYENEKARKDLLMPKDLYSLVIEQIDGLLVSPEDFIVYLDFANKINSIKALDENQKSEYKKRCLIIIRDDIYPAYEKLKACVNAVMNQADSDLGVCSWKNGKDYYNYIIKRETSYDMTGDELRSFVKSEIASCISEIKDTYVNNPELLKIDNLGELLPKYGSLEDIYNVEEQCLKDQFYDYDIDRASEYIIPPYLEDYVAAGFYFPVSIDGLKYGNMYLQEKAYTSLDASTLELYFHENIPGHHFYFSKFYSSDVPLIRKVCSWLPYEEGWAQYMQNVSIDYFGLSEPLTKLLKSSSKLSYYHMLLIDTQYHYDGISEVSAITAYLDLGYPEAAAKKAVARMIAHPGEIIHYIYGDYKMESYLAMCQKALNDKFDIKSFHDMILKNAGLPFTTMDDVITDYIKSCNQNTKK